MSSHSERNVVARMCVYRYIVFLCHTYGVEERDGSMASVGRYYLCGLKDSEGDRQAGLCGDVGSRSSLLGF